MGANEFGIGDYDCDQDVDLTDFVTWRICMLGPDNGPYRDGCEAFDGNLDLDIDLHDFAIFQNSMTGGTSTIAVFVDTQTAFSTTDVRDVNGDIVRFDTSTDSIIWAASGAAYQTGFWPVNGVFLAGGGFQVRFGTQGGQRRAYFTETGNGFICQIAVIGGNLFISGTNVPVPQG